ncbi:MAG: hypothetical protein Q8L98_06200 [Chlamydiales bacterium]|nr:hypothetical protein [Chlamydiales bacterium]
MKHWMQDTAKLEPFSSWFEQFEEKPPIKGEVGVKSHSFIVSKVGPSSIDTQFFQSLMTFVGQQVAICLRGTIEDFQKNPANGSLKSKIEWYGEGEQLETSSFSKSSSAHLHIVKVSLWLEKQQPCNKPFWGSWV